MTFHSQIILRFTRECFLLIFLLAVSEAHSQPATKSTEDDYKAANGAIERVELAIALASSSSENSAALEWAYRAINDASTTRDRQLIAKAYASLGNVHFRVTNQIDSARFYYDIALSKLKGEQDDSVAIKINDLYVSLLYNANNHTEAIEKNLYNLRYYEKVGDKKMAAYTYNRLANSNNYLGYHDVAMKYYNTSLDLYKDLGDYYGMGKVYGNMAIIYSEELDIEKSIAYNHLSIKYYGMGGTALDQAHSYVNIGADFTTMNQLDSSEYYLKKAYNIFNQHPDEEIELAFCLQNLGKLYEVKKDYKKALEVYKSALRIGYKVGSAQLIINNHEFLADVYDALNDHKNAYQNFRQSKHLADSLNALANTKLIAEMQSNYENAKQAAENEQLKAKSLLDEATIQQQKSYTSFFAITVFILLASSLVLYTAYRKILFQKQQSDKDRKLIAKQADKLKKNDRLKSQFFSNISHELRTPLTILMGTLDQFINLAQHKLEENERKKLHVARENGHKIKELIDEVFELTKMDAQKVKLQTKPEKILPIIERIVFAFHSLASEKNQELTISYGQVHNVYLNIDISRFEKIINNLIVNAIKFTQSGGWIKVTLGLKNNGEILEMEIADNGPGISEEDQSHIFERYYQSQQDQDMANPGTGLGLAMVKELTKLHGGKVTVSSQQGQGTSFKLTFPVAQLASSSTKAKQHEYLDDMINTHTNSAKGNEKNLIMVVEDNPDMRSFLRDIFEPEHRVLACQNGEEALIALRTSLPSLIVTDLMMPLMDGKTLLKHLKNDQKQSQIPVIILTAKMDELEKLDALRLGVDDYITKPFNANEIKIKAGNLIKNARSRMEWQATEDTESNADHLDDQFVQQVAKFVKDNIQNTHIHIAELASHLAMSERQLFRKIGSSTGLTPNQFIREIKLRHAHELIRKKSITKVSILAKEVGFESGPYFSRLYFERYGKKPSEELG